MKMKPVTFQRQLLVLTAALLMLGLGGTAWAQGMKDGGMKDGGMKDGGMKGMSPSMKMPAAQGGPMKMMTMMKEMAAKVPRFPPVRGFGDGGEVFFIHSETSDPKISELLSMMMASPVITVPELGKTPEDLLANVYVFKNGVKGMGPLGFQPDIFDHLPGTPGYRPLRRILFVTWKNPASAYELRSVEKLMQARSKGDLGIERTKVVVNMPMLMWPLGRR
ncbi:MAG: hypothetical protein IIC13_14805 [SAR324 cluster bacterium]|nr:hypothetical protein [SAR324 cluster bacterium]